jgi:hypothetical protein
MKAKSLFIAAMAVAALSACSNEEESYVKSERPVFSGVIDGIKTRAFDRTWYEGNTIGITAGNGETYFNKPYEVNGEGTSVGFTATDDEVLFTSNVPETFIAYFPYSPYTMSPDVNTYYRPESGGTERISTLDQSDPQSIDFLWAKAVGSHGNPSVDFVFKHVMSEITLKFKKGDVSSLENLRFTLSGLTMEGVFDVMNGTAHLDGDGYATDITLQVTMDGDGNSIQSSSETGSATAIFFPQDVSTIGLTVTLGTSSYSATLELPEATNYQLLAGYNVEFEIEVNKNALKTDNGSIIGWNTQKGNYTTAFGHEAKDAKLYDLAMSDGTFITVWDPEDTNKYSENIEKLTENQLANVVGIVYWLSTGDEDNVVTPLTDDALLASDHSDCTHGYILALKDMALEENGSATTIQWQDKSYYEESVSEAIEGMDAKFKPQSENSILISYNDIQSSGDTEKLNKALGYNNTKLLRAYNYYCADYNHKVRPIEYLDLFAAKNEAPKGSSGWYLPSPKELVLMVLEDNSDIIFYDYGKSITTQFSNIQLILEALGENASKMGSWYWSSSECEYTEEVDIEDESVTVISYYAWDVGFIGSYYGYVDLNNKDVNYYVRAVCAF